MGNWDLAIDPERTEAGKVAIFRESETMRRVNELADLLARECPLLELLAAVRQTERDA
jgi:hypothetical protein